MVAFRESGSRVPSRFPIERLPAVVPSGSGGVFAGTRCAEQRASTTAVDGRLPLRLEKGERRDYDRASLLQFVQTERDARARSGTCSPSRSDSASPLAGRRALGDRQASRGRTGRAGVAPEFMAKHNCALTSSGAGPPTRGRDSRLATRKCAATRGPRLAFSCGWVSQASCRGWLCPTAVVLRCWAIGVGRVAVLTQAAAGSERCWVTTGVRR